jgi:hypothetical protein
MSQLSPSEILGDIYLNVDSWTSSRVWISGGIAQESLLLACFPDNYQVHVNFITIVSKIKLFSVKKVTQNAKYGRFFGCFISSK